MSLIAIKPQTSKHLSQHYVHYVDRTKQVILRLHLEHFHYFFDTLWTKNLTERL